jgi:hypothetical protein
LFLVLALVSLVLALVEVESVVPELVKLVLAPVAVEPAVVVRVVAELEAVVVEVVVLAVAPFHQYNHYQCWFRLPQLRHPKWNMAHCLPQTGEPLVH